MMKTSDLAKTLARELRKKQTVAEKVFWGEVRNRNFLGLKFTRQHPIYYKSNKKKKFFIADFFCSELKLIIEIDGKIHDYQKEYDQAREEILKSKKLIILRFKNDEIENSLNLSLLKLKEFIDLEFPSLLRQRRVRDE